MVCDLCGLFLGIFRLLSVPGCFFLSFVFFLVLMHSLHLLPLLNLVLSEHPPFSSPRIRSLSTSLRFLLFLPVLLGHLGFVIVSPRTKMSAYFLLSHPFFPTVCLRRPFSLLKKRVIRAAMVETRLSGKLALLSSTFIWVFYTAFF